MRKSVLLLALLISLGMYAGEKAKWERAIGDQVEWFQLLQSGNILAVTKTKALCLNAQDGNIIWENTELANLEEANFETIPMSNIAILGGETSIIINVSDGKKVFSTADAGIKEITFKKTLPKIGCIAFVGELDKSSDLYLVNYSTGELKWKVNLGKKKSSLSKGLGAAAALGGVPTRPVFDNELKIASNGTVIFTNSGKVYNISPSNGILNWTYEPKEKAKKVFIMPDEKSFILVSGDVTGLTGDHTIEGIDIENGNQLWGELEYKGVFDNIIFEEDGALTFSSRGMHKIDFKKGKSLMKEYPAYGMTLTHFIKTDKGYIIGKEQNETSQIIYYIGFDGKSIWKKGKNTSKIFDLELRDAELYAFTTSGLSAIDMLTGKPVQGKGADATTSFWANDKKNSVIASYSSGTITLLNPENYTAKVIAEDIEFMWDETPRRIEVRENGYLLSSKHNLYLVDFTGKKIYHKYYRPLGESFGNSMAKFGADLAMTTVSAVIAVNSFDNASNIGEGLSNAGTVFAVSDVVANEADKRMFERYNFDPKELNKTKIVLSRLREEGDMITGFLGVVNVDKETGEELKKIELNQKEPKYIIDPITKLFFVKAKDGSIKAYQL